MNKENKLSNSIIILALITGFLLLIPLVAMQFSDEVVWALSDFIIAGTILFGTGFAYILVTQILATQIANNIIYRIALGFALFTGLFLIWTNLAVGIIGHSGNPANIMYFGVIAVGIIGAFIARFRAEGMVFTMFATAIAQALVTVTVLLGGLYQSPPGTVIHILGVNGFFITLFVVSALLFRHAVQEQPLTHEEQEV